MSISLGEQLGDEFRHIGPVVPFSESRIGYEDVRPLYELVTEKFLPAATTKILNADEVSTSVAGMVMFRPFHRAEEEEPSRSVAVLMSYDASHDGWSMKARVATHSGSLQRRTKIMLYEVATRDESVLSATKATGFILQKTDVSVVNDEFMETSSVERKKYEKLLDAGDCLRLGVIIDRAARRAPFKFPML